MRVEDGRALFACNCRGAALIGGLCLVVVVRNAEATRHAAAAPTAKPNAGFRGMAGARASGAVARWDAANTRAKPATLGARYC